MKKVIILVVCLLLAAIFLLSFITPAVFADDFDYFTMEQYVDVTSIPTTGGNITLSVKISHKSNSAYVMSSAKVYKGDTQIINFGNIYAGQETLKSGEYTVSESEVANGVTFILKWSESNNTQREKEFTIIFDNVVNAEPKVNFTSTVSQTTGVSNTNVTINYRVENTGSLSLYDLVISDAAVGEIRLLSILKPGQYTTASAVKRIEDGFTSTPKLDYTAGGENYSTSLDSIEVSSGQPGISLEVTSSTNLIDSSSSFILYFTITNTGTTDFTSIYVNENTLGKILTTAELKAGESKQFTIEKTLDKTYTYEFIAAGDNGGEQEWTGKAEITITVDDSQKPLNAKIDAIASAIQLVYPGSVSFDITVTNTGTDMLKELTVSDHDGTIIEEIPQLITGKSVFQYSVKVEKTTTFTFTLKAKAKDGIEKNISTSPIKITVLNPEPTQETKTIAPVPAATADKVISDKTTKGLSDIAKILAVVVLSVLFVAIVLALVVQKKNRKKRH